MRRFPIAPAGKQESITHLSPASTCRIHRGRRMEQKQLRIGVRRWNRSFTGVSGVPLGRLTLSPKVAAEVAYKNAKENTPHNARMAHDQAPGQGEASLEGRHAGLQAV